MLSNEVIMHGLSDDYHEPRLQASPYNFNMLVSGHQLCPCARLFLPSVPKEKLTRNVPSEPYRAQVTRYLALGRCLSNRERQEEAWKQATQVFIILTHYCT